MPRRAIVSVVVVVGAVLLVGLVALLIVRPWEPPSSPLASAGASAAAGEQPDDLRDATTHVLDDAGEGAPVVVEFLDYECPACGQLQPVVDDLRQQYAGDVTFAVRYFPLPGHPDAVPAALAVEAAAQQGQFEPMHATVFEHQGEWSGSDDAATMLRGYAESLGLDMAAYDAAVADAATLDRIALDANAGIAAGVERTPSFFVDGEIVDLQRVSDLTDAIDAALAD